MDKNKLWIIGAVLVMVVVAAGGWFLGIEPQLNAANTSSAQLTAVSGTNQQDAAELTKLKADYSHLPQLQAQLDGLRQSIPAVTSYPSLVSELGSIAASSGVTLSGWTFTDATPYAPVAAPVTASASSASSTSSSSSSTPTPTPTPTPAPSQPAGPPAAGMPPYTNGAISASNFVDIPVSVDATGSYADTLAFVKQLQTAQRLFLVTSVSLSETATTSGQFTSTIGGLVYVLPTAPAAG